MQEAHLARLRYALLIGEAARAKQPGAVGYIIEQAHVQQEARAGCTGATLARITMNDDHITIIFH